MTPKPCQDAPNLTMEITVALDKNQQEVRTAVLTGLLQHNELFLGAGGRTDLAISARDTNGTVIGGATGGVYYDRLMIDLLWIAEGHRGNGLGSRILTEMETRARSIGACKAIVDTLSFQAAPFYEKLGYTEAGRIPNFLAEFDRIYFTKDLTA